MPLFQALRGLFATPARQALGWAALGMVGIGAAGGGVLLLSETGGSPPAAPTAFVDSESALAPSATPTAAPSAPPTRVPSPSPTATPADGAVAAANAAPATVAATQPADEAPEAALPEPTEEPPPPAAVPADETPYVPGVDAPHVHVPGTEYCVRSASGAPTPPNTVFGLLEIGGQPVPAGTVVTLTFDGVPGKSEAIAEAGGYRLDWNAGGQGCANQVGSAMALVVDGVSYPVGTVGGNMIMRVDIVVP